MSAFDARADEFAAVAHSIWQYAELGYLEQQSSALLQEQLAAADFRIEQGVAGIPTAFIAERGSGRPVVALLAEFDALPGLSQQAVADVNWMVPTSDLGTATWVPGTASHSWQAVAVGGTDIGNKGMLVAAKVLALTAVDLFLRPDLSTRLCWGIGSRRWTIGSSGWPDSGIRVG